MGDYHFGTYEIQNRPTTLVYGRIFGRAKSSSTKYGPSVMKQRTFAGRQSNNQSYSDHLNLCLSFGCGSKLNKYRSSSSNS